MKQRIFLAISILCLTVVFLATSSAWAKVKIRLAHVDQPGRFDSCMGAQSNTFKDLVESMSDGEIEVTIYPAGQLGNMREMVESTQMGSTQIVHCFTSVGTIFSPPLMAVQIPFIFPTAAYAWHALDGWWGRELADRFLKDTGLRVISWGEGFGFRVIWNNRNVVKTPADLKGLKIRVPESKGLLALFRALGSSPVTITWTELYTAMQTKTVDGCEPELGGGIQIKLEETTKYVTMTNHAYNIHAMFLNEKWFQAQTPKHKKIIIEAGRIATIASRGMSQNFTGHALAKCLAKGIKIYTPTPEEMDQFAKIGQPAYLEVVKKEAGQEWIDKTLKAAEEAKKALGAEMARIVK